MFKVRALRVGFSVTIQNALMLNTSVMATMTVAITVMKGTVSKFLLTKYSSTHALTH